MQFFILASLQTSFQKGTLKRNTALSKPGPLGSTTAAPRLFTELDEWPGLLWFRPRQAEARLSVRRGDPRAENIGATTTTHDTAFDVQKLFLTSGLFQFEAFSAVGILVTASLG